VDIQAVILAATTSVLLLARCNLSYQDVSDAVCDSLHPVRPIPVLPQSRYCHGAMYRFPSGACDEVQCHGAVLSGGNSGAPSCYSCHGDRWTIFSTTHTLKIGGYFHDSRVDSQSYPAFPDCALAACHGPGLLGVPGAGYPCRLCHDPIPPPGHRVNQEGARHHYNLCLTPHLTYCGTAVCHGTTASLNDGAAPPCANCHSAGRTCD